MVQSLLTNAPSIQSSASELYTRSIRFRRMRLMGVFLRDCLIYNRERTDLYRLILSYHLPLDSI